ncbi:MAG: peptide chain release factor 1 [Leptospiraceae bacterium]|nr:peptide chain release factor 1 [Leptospiraceae bacterium]MDW8306136.1 peptide chain release factor 1 [Leptospiraceae bacterium]
MAELNETVLREIEQEFHTLEERLLDPSVQKDVTKLRELTRERARLFRIVELIQKRRALLTELSSLREQLGQESDAEMLHYLAEEKQRLEENLAKIERELKLALLPKDPDSGKDVIVEIRAGTGGEEAALFARDLLRMYLKFLDKKGVPTEILDLSPSSAGGVKEAIFAARGELAYDLLHFEAGAHRVQRIPATEANGRIHTSAVTVAVLPEAEEEEVDIQSQDLRIDVMRASGAGGQYVNKTESAVRITHIPTGIVVYMQEERSQSKNKEKALRILRARLYEKMRRERHEKLAMEKRAQVGSGDRSEKIRTYNFPQNRITDHRIGYTAYNLDQVLEGELDDLISALETHRQEELLQTIH